MNELLGLIISFALTVFAVLVLICTLTLCGRWGKYKSQFKRVTNRKYVRNRDQVYLADESDWRDYGFAWFLSSDDFAIGQKTYLHNSYYTYLDPYSFYWLVKYRRWFKNNVDPNGLPEYTFKYDRNNGQHV